MTISGITRILSDYYWTGVILLLDFRSCSPRINADSVALAERCRYYLLCGAAR